MPMPFRPAVDPLRLVAAAGLILAGGFAVAAMMAASGQFRMVWPPDVLPVRVSVAWLLALGTVCLMPGLWMLTRAVRLSGLPAERDAWPGGRWARASAVILRWTGILCLPVLVYGASGVERLDREVRDLFHEGEILGAFPLVNGSVAVADYPLLIHGPGRNLLPALVAGMAGDPAAGIVTMRLVTGLLDAASVLAGGVACFLAALAVLRFLPPALRPVQARAVAALIAAAVGLHALKGVSSREALYLATVAVALLLLGAVSGRRGRAGDFSACVLGAVTVLAPVYTYRPGVQAIVVAGVAFCLSVALWPQRGGRLFLAACAGAALAGLGLVAAGALPLVLLSVRDIVYWAGAGAAIWSLPGGGDVIRYVAGVLLLMAITGLQVVRALRASPADRPGAAFWLLMLFLFWISGQAYASRSDDVHILQATVSAMPALAALVALAVGQVARLVPHLVRGGAALAGVVVLALCIGVGFRGSGGLAGALARLGTPDAAVLPADARDLVATYRPYLERQDCLLVFTNEGVLNQAAGLPPCGPAFYPIYLDRAGDARMARWVTDHPQAIAIIDSTFWSARIDGIAMAERMPQTLAALTASLPVTERAGRWEIRRVAAP